MNLDFFINLANNIKENKEVQNLIKDLGDFLLKQNISSDNLNVDIDYNICKNKLQDYFSSDGKDLLSKLTNGNIDGIAYYVLVTENKNQKRFYGSNSTEMFSKPISSEILNDISSPIAFRIKDGEIVVDEQLSKDFINLEKTDTPTINIVKQIELNSNMDFYSSIKLIKERDNILKTFSMSKSLNLPFYYVLCKSKAQASFEVLKYNNGKSEKLAVLEMDLPENSGVNSILRLENGNYVIDSNATNEITQKIVEASKEILKNQNPS